MSSSCRAPPHLYFIAFSVVALMYYNILLSHPRHLPGTVSPLLSLRPKICALLWWRFHPCKQHVGPNEPPPPPAPAPPSPHMNKRGVPLHPTNASCRSRERWEGVRGDEWRDACDPCCPPHPPTVCLRGLKQRERAFGLIWDELVSGDGVMATHRTAGCCISVAAAPGGGMESACISVRSCCLNLQPKERAVNTGARRCTWRDGSAGRACT